MNYKLDTVYTCSSTAQQYYLQERLGVFQILRIAEPSKHFGVAYSRDESAMQAKLLSIILLSVETGPVPKLSKVN